MHKDIRPLIKNKQQVSFAQFYTDKTLNRKDFTKTEFYGNKKTCLTYDTWTVYTFSNGFVRILEELAKNYGKQTEYLYK